MKHIEVIFKNILLKLLLLFSGYKNSNALKTFNSNDRILFIRLNRIGDAIITTPLLKLVKEKIGCQIFVLADRKNKVIFENNPSIDKIFVFKKSILNILKFNRFIRSQKIDAVVDLHDDVSTTVSFLIARSGAQYRFGLKKSNYKIFTHTIEKIDPTNNHIVDRILKLSELFAIKYEGDREPEYFPCSEALEATDKFIDSNHLNNKFLLGINISAGSMARFWGTSRYKKLLSKVSEYDINVIIIRSPNDKFLAEEITENNFVIFEDQSFDEYAAMISKLDLLFSPDTSAVHLASVFKVPVFGIYINYNTDDMIWSPYNTEFDAVITSEPNLLSVSSSEVINKFIPFLEKIINDSQNSRL